MILNFITEREFDPDLNMFSLGTREWEPMSNENTKLIYFTQTHAPDELRNSQLKTKV